MGHLVLSPPDNVPTLIHLLPKAHLAAILVELRAAARQLHDEDNMPAMDVIRFFAKLRDGKAE